MRRPVVKYIYLKKISFIAILLALSIGNAMAQVNGDNQPLIFNSKASIAIPSVSGGVIIDGLLTDKIWDSAIILPLSGEAGKNGLPGGETRIVLYGSFLCLSASAPDNDRLAVHSSGINPVMWQEDLIVWRIRYKSPVNGRNISLSVAVNPAGAFSLLSGDYYFGRNDIINGKDAPVIWSAQAMVSTSIDESGWKAEAAIPIADIGSLGFLSVERIRPLRPEAPEYRWYWPSAYTYVDYTFIKGHEQPEPEWKPSVYRNEAPVRHAKNYSATSGISDSDIFSLPKQAWTTEERKFQGVDSALEKSIRSRIRSYAEKEKTAWLKVNTLADWELFRNARIEELKKWIGHFPARTPLKSIVTASRNYGDGFILENIAFESRPGLLVAANLYRPEKITGKIPAIIIVHSLHYPKTQLELQEMGMTLARSGTAVLVMDQLCAGERTQSQPWPREGYYGRYALGNQLYLAGESLIKWMAWDISRSVDLLIEKQYIDTTKIALIGAVAGGGDPAALAAILDERIAAVIPFNFGEAGPEEHYLEGPRPYDKATADPGWAYWETTRNIPFSISKQFFPWFLCAASAPRYFAYSIEMGWPSSVEEEPAWARYKKVFGLYKAQERLAEMHGFGPFPGPGEAENISVFMRRRLDTILHHWFRVDFPALEYRRALPESDLLCLTPAIFSQHHAVNASSLALDQVKPQLDSARRMFASLPESLRIMNFRKALQEKLGDIQPARKIVSRFLWTKNYSRFQLQAFAIQMEAGIQLPLFLLSPLNHPGKSPVVIAIASGGKEKFLVHRAGEIAALLDKGISVCLPDLRNQGELTNDTSRGPDAMSLAANELMLGGTMTGAQLKDMRSIFKWLRSFPGADAQKIALWGDSFSAPNDPGFMFDHSWGQKPGPVTQRQAEPLGPFLAMLTALYEKDIYAIASNGMLLSFSAALEDRFCHIPQDIVVPGILQVADLNDIARVIAKRPILLKGMVDGRNMPVGKERVNKEYGSILPAVTLTNNSDPYSLSDWLTEQLQQNKTNSVKNDK